MPTHVHWADLLSLALWTEVTSERWRDMTRLFERRGGPSYCWCRVFRAEGAEKRKTDSASRVWFIACFFIDRRIRGQGAMHQVLQAAIARAKMNGAAVVKAYPVEPDSPSYRFMGFVPTFHEAGSAESTARGPDAT